MFGKIKVDRADALFSKYIRKRDGECVRCHSRVEFNSNGDPVSHQNSHYFSRRNEGTRFDPENCDTLCGGCHHIWGGDGRDEYKAFKIKQLGEQGFKLLRLRSDTYKRKDRKMSYIIAKALYSTLKEV